VVVLLLKSGRGFSNTSAGTRWGRLAGKSYCMAFLQGLYLDVDVALTLQ